MDYKTATVLILGIISFTVVSFGVLWFSPFQDSEVSGELSGKFRIGDVNIPIISAESSMNKIPDTKYYVDKLVDNEYLGDIGLGEILLEGEISLSGKNLEKLVRGIMIPQFVIEKTDLKVIYEEVEIEPVQNITQNFTLRDDIFLFSVIFSFLLVTMLSISIMYFADKLKKENQN